jgi:hypothetical protein
MGLVLRLDAGFFSRPNSQHKSKPHLQKVLACGHPCHTWDLGLGTHVKW